LRPPTNTRGRVSGVDFGGLSRVAIVGAASFLVPCEQGDIARTAMREGREVEILGLDDEVSARTVRVLPKVVEKARGRVDFIEETDDDGNGCVSFRESLEVWRVDAASLQAAARAFAGAQEIGIVSVDGGPDQVRVCE